MRYQKQIPGQLSLGLSDYPELARYDSPCNDNERFWNLQKEWIETGSSKAWGEMYLLVDLLAQKALKKALKKRGIVIDEETFANITGEVVDSLMGRYRKYYGYLHEYIVTQVFWETKKSLNNRNDEFLRKTLEKLNSGELTFADMDMYAVDMEGADDEGEDVWVSGMYEIHDRDILL